MEIYLKQHETRTFESLLTDEAGAPLVLTGATVLFRIKSEGGVQTTKTAEPVAGSPGRVRVKLTALDTAEVGDHRAEWAVTVGGETRVVPTRGFWDLYVRASLLPAPSP